MDDNNGWISVSCIDMKREIEQQKSQIDELKRNVFGILAERESLKLDNKRQAAEIESLKQENAKATQLLERIFLSAPEPLASEIYSFIRSKRSISNASQ